MTMEEPDFVEVVILLDCPADGCDTQIAEDDLAAQRQHMESCHPELVIAIAAENERLDGWTATC